MARSSTCWFSRKVPAWDSRQSTSVVLPWSTWAMMAMLRMCSAFILKVVESLQLLKIRNPVVCITAGWLKLARDHVDTRRGSQW